MFEPHISDDSSSDDDEDLTPGEIRLKLERRQLREEEREKRALNAATLSACCTVVLNDKGTRIGAELWAGGGIIVTHSLLPGRPCLLTTADMVPDAYHAAHATVYFNGSVEPQSLKLASTDFLVVSSDESLLDEFPPGETSFAKEINYSMVALAGKLPAGVEPIVLGRLGPEMHKGDSIVVLEASCAAVDAPGLFLEARARAMRSLASLAFSPDPTLDKSIRRGSAVFARQAGVLTFAGLYQGYAWDESHLAESEAAEQPGNLAYLSRGQWTHLCYTLDPVLQHLRNAAAVLEARSSNAKVAMATFLGSGNPRRERIQASLDVLHLILSDPSQPPPDLFEASDAQLLAVQAQGRGFKAVLTLLRVYTKDEEMQRYGLEALASLLSDGRDASAPSVADEGGVELIALALQRHGHNAALVAAAAQNIALLAVHTETSRRFLRCGVSEALVTTLRAASQMGSHHLEAQRWGLIAVATLARNGDHLETMCSEGICAVLPGLLSNDMSVIKDMDLQRSGLHCILELSRDSADTLGEALLEGGIMKALRLVQKHGAGSDEEWRQLSAEVFEELNWEE